MGREAAFPRPASRFANGMDEAPPQTGMDIRDYFAAHIMPFVMGQMKTMQHKGDTSAVMLAAAQTAYLYADALMKARRPF